MTKNKVWKITAILACLASFASLGTQMFFAHLQDAAAFGKYTAYGFNLPEFSPLGCIPIIMPILLIALLFIRLSSPAKCTLTLALSLVNAVSLNHALIALNSETVGSVPWVVYMKPGVFLYFALITIAECLVLFAINQPNIKRTSLKLFGTCFSILSFVSLALPLYYTVLGESETMNITLRGFNLLEFSPWAFAVILAPILMFLLAHKPIGAKLTFALEFALCALGILGLYLARNAAYLWLLEDASIPIVIYDFWLFYVILLFLAALFFALSCALPPQPIDIYRERFFLFNCPCTVCKFTKTTSPIESVGHISFSTQDGYFAALGHGEDETYLKNGCIEFFDDDENLGYVMRSMQSGVYGTFYKTPFFGKRMKIKPFLDIRDGGAELWLPTGIGFEKFPVQIHPTDITRIECVISCDPSEPLDGTIIVQDNKIAAVVSGFDKKSGSLVCVSAEQVAADLSRMAYEQETLKTMK